MRNQLNRLDYKTFSIKRCLGKKKLTGEWSDATFMSCLRQKSKTKDIDSINDMMYYGV